MAVPELENIQMTNAMAKGAWGFLGSIIRGKPGEIQAGYGFFI
jgi:hypothetical protein